MSQPFGFSCTGGLNTNLNEFDMLKQPGVAKELTNFEVHPDGGYRRVNGYTPFGTTKLVQSKLSSYCLSTYYRATGLGRGIELKQQRMLLATILLQLAKISQKFFLLKVKSDSRESRLFISLVCALDRF